MSLFGKIYSTMQAFRKLVALAETNTYYPEEPRKSKLRILYENLLWILKKREVNYYYYLQGFDRIGVNPDDYFALPEFVRLRDHANSGIYADHRKANYTCLLQDKFLFAQYLKSLDFRTPQTLALCDGDEIIWLDDERIEPIDALAEHDGLDAFLKPTVGWQGENVFRLTVCDGKVFLNGQETNTVGIRNRMQGKYIIQTRLRQLCVLARIYPDSVNTLRIVTARTPANEICVLSSIFRMGTNGNLRDNWCSGGITAGIDIETGRLKKYGYLNPKYGRKVTCHPDTNVPLEGFEIPFYREAEEAAKGLHFFFYGLHSVGWDIAITEDGPVFIEGNDDWGIRVIQPHDRTFKRRFLETLGRPIPEMGT
jgi:hypothetical protein